VPSVTRRTSKHARTRRGAAEQQILDATEALLAEGESFTALGIGRIADHAGVSRSSFYLHFPDKTALLLRMTETATSTLFAAAEGWVGDPDHDLAGLVATCEQMVAEYRRHAPLLTAFAEVAGYEPVVDAFWRDRIAAFIAMLERRMRRDRDAGLLPADLDAATAAQFLAWGVERTVAQHVSAHPGSARRDRRLAAGMAAAIWQVMGPRPAAAR
jgi:AcrR family transcriptional regulator